jgi:hypothetical protein
MGTVTYKYQPGTVATPVIYTRYEGDKAGVEFDKRPCVARFTFGCIERAVMKPEALGYRMVGWDYQFFSVTYARPLPIWLACKVGWLLRSGYRRLLLGRALCWLSKKGFVGYVGSEAEIFQWRCVRPGRRLLHPWRPSHHIKLSRDNWIWWFDAFWFHHKIRLICWWELHRHGYTWRDARALLKE